MILCVLHRQRMQAEAGGNLIQLLGLRLGETDPDELALLRRPARRAGAQHRLIHALAVAIPLRRDDAHAMRPISRSRCCR